MNKKQAIQTVEGMAYMGVSLTRQSFVAIGELFSGRYTLTDKEKDKVIEALKKTSPRFKAEKFREFLD